jgi:DNA-binding CsgD family transcriptional regulator
MLGKDRDLTKVKRPNAHELWAAMRQTGTPFALIEPATRLFVDANEQYAALFERDQSEIKGMNFIDMYRPELRSATEGMLDAFAHGTLHSVRGQGPYRRSNGETIKLIGWSRRFEGYSEHPLVVTATVDEASDQALPDDRFWVAQAPEVFGLSDDSSRSAQDDVATRVDQLEQHLWRIAMEVRAAGLMAVVGESSSPGPVRELMELTTRQREIVARLVDGQRVKQIAQDMYLTPSTVRNHLSAVFRKFHVHSQTDLIALLNGPRLPG